MMHRQSLRILGRVLFAWFLATAWWSRGAQAPGGGAWRPAGGALPGDPAAASVMVQTLASDDQLQQLVFRFPAPQLRQGPDGLFEVLLSSADESTEPGKPVLPLVTARIALPQGHEVVSLEVLPGAGHDYVLGGAVRHAQMPHPISRPADWQETPPAVNLYASDDPYPASLSSSFSIQTKRGVAFADFVLHPVVYRPATGRLTAYETLIVELRTRPVPDDGAGLALAADAGAWRARYRSAADARAVSGLLDNPEVLDAYQPEPGDTGDGVLRLAAGELPTNPSDTFHYVIITSAGLKASIQPYNFQRIIALREAQGLPSVIVTVEDILAAYSGSDEAAAVRAFIRDAYDKWDTEYVLLGGDQSVLPVRYLHAQVGDRAASMASDLYFQCLDGSFDSNGNNRFGEPGDGADRTDGRAGDDIDLYAEVAIGRIPVTNDLTLANWAFKQVTYETDRLAGDAAYLRGVLMLGEHLRFGGVAEYAEPMLEEIRLGASAHGYRTTGFVGGGIHTDVSSLNDTPYVRWGTGGLADLINQERFSLMNHIGHASENQAMRFENLASAPERDAQVMLVNEKPLFVYSQGCGIGNFGHPSRTMAHVFLAETGVGMFGGVFNSEFGWGMRNSTDGPSQRFNRWFWHSLLAEWTPALGLLNQQAHERNAARIDDVAMRWVYYSSNLLGDPAQWLYGMTPSVRLDRRAYRSDAAAVIEVFWPLAGAGRQTVDAVLELVAADGVTVTGVTNLVCQRRGPVGYSGRYFSDPVALADLGAVDGGAVTATAEMTMGTNVIVYSDQAPVHDDPPAVSNLQVSAVDELWIEVSWDSDRPVSGAARAGTELPLTGDWTAGPTGVATRVTVRLEGLTPFTRYDLGVQAEDEAGNVTAVPADLFSTNAADYLSGSTIGRETVVRYDWSRDEQGWTVTNINGAVCWEYGEPYAYGPQGVGRCWGTILNGRYLDGANAYLSSPSFAVRHSPLIRFRHWHEMQDSTVRPDALPTPVPYGDYGQVEVLSGGVWQNVTAYADVSEGAAYLTDSSGGWRHVRIALPVSFANQTLAVRFRFVSDEQQFEEGNPAGWYVSDVIVSDMPASGLGISRVDLDDLDAGAGPSGLPGLSGDGDFLPEAGETLAIRPRLHNYGGGTFSALTGSMTVLVAGDSSVLAAFPDGAPAPVAYGPVGPMETVPAQAWTRLQLSPALEPGTVVTLLQTVTNTAGLVYESRYDLRVDQYATISGRVEAFGSGTPVVFARVETVEDGETVSAVSDGDGRFDLHGLRPEALYTVMASKVGEYTPQSQPIQAPETNAVFVLGISEGSLSPTNLVFSVAAGGAETQVLTVSNAATATAVLEGALETVAYGAGASGWLSTVPPAFSVAVDAAAVLNVTADAAALAVGQYRAVLVLTTDGPGLGRVEIPVLFTVHQNPDLAFGGALIADDDDGDGHLEAGENAEMWIFLNNLSGVSDAGDLEGTLAPLHPNVMLTGSDLITWSHIPEYGSRLSDNGVGLALDPGHLSGEPLEFLLTVVHGGDQTNTFNFFYAPRFHHAVTGRVDVTVWAADPADVEVLPLQGAVVTARDAAGLVYSSLPTGTNGVYTLAGVPEGDIWFTVVHPSGYPYVMPPGTNLLVTAPAELDFMAYDFGVNAPWMRLYDVVVDDSAHGDGDGMIDPGERLLLQARIYNTGGSSAMSVSGRLSVASMGPLGPFMAVNVDQSAPPQTITPVSIHANPVESPWMLAELGVFEVEVDAGAVEGDVQRFLLQVTDGQTPAWVWPLEFSLTVEPRYTVSGTVSFADPVYNTLEFLGGLTVRVEYNGAGGDVLTAADGSYRHLRIPPGAAVTVRVQAPEGFVALPADHTVASLAADTGGLDFVLGGDPLQVTPASLSVTLNEGAATNVLLTLENAAIVPLTADLSVVYKRGMYDVVHPEDPLASILGGLDADGWAGLSADDHVANELEIRFADGVDWMERQAVLEQYGLRALFHLTLVPACVAVPVEGTMLSDEGASSLGPLALSLEADPRILYVQPSAKIEPQSLPNDPLLDRQYALRNTRQTGGTLGADINVAPVWEQGITGSRDIIVAVFDTGMDLAHEDLAANVWRNPREQPGDANGDGYPGIRGVDDDGDAESSRWHYHTQTGILQGPEMVDPRFEPSMWADVRSLVPVPGKQGVYQWIDGPNDIPDFFEPYLLGVPLTPALTAPPAWYVSPFGVTNAWGAELVPVLVDVNGDGVLDIQDLLADPRFVDSNGDGIPDIFADSVGDGIPDIFRDEDGDGVINETGIDFRDQDVMMADYYGIGRPLVIQKRVPLPWPGPFTFSVLAEQWHVPVMPRAATDDDENGFADDLNGWNLYAWSGNVSDMDRIESHGTHVAGIIGAVGDNGLGAAGVNWDVSLMPMPSMRPDGVSPTFGRMAKGIEYALKQGARVSNHSWGGTSTAGILFEVMKRAERDYNHLFVVAAGNTGENLDQTRRYPAYYSTVLNNVITVAASDHDGQLASFATWGPGSVQIAAPGVDIVSTMALQVLPMSGEELSALNDLLYYGYKSGSSMAAPHVAGAAALLWSHVPAARYEAIREALLNGARPDPNLQGRIQTGGHLDVARALSALGRDWLALSTHQVVLAAVGGTEDVEVYFNTDRHLKAGVYEAEILVTHAVGQRRVPVTLTVLEQPVARLAAIRQVADTDGDGYAEPGETVDFHLALDNTGGGTFINLNGTLSALTPGVVVDTAVAAWDYLYSGDRGESLTAYRVVLPAGAPDPVVFELTLTAQDAADQTLTVELPVAVRHSIRGRVETSGGVGVPGVPVEYRGAAGGRAVSVAGGDYALHGLVDGTYTLRALPADLARSPDAVVGVVGGDAAGVDLVVGSQDIAFSVARLDVALPAGLSATQTLTVANAATDAYAFDIEVMPRRRIGLFADGPGLELLEEPLRRMGFEVGLYTGNFAIVHTIHPDTGVQTLQQQIRHTQDDANVFAYDLVIADLTGPGGGGRVFTDLERGVFERYLDRGGRVIFTGGHPLTRPDNAGLAALAGVAVTNRAAAAVGEAVALASWAAPFVDLAVGDRIAVNEWIYDLAPVADSAAEVLFSAGTASKLVQRPAAGSAGTGTVWLWNGNPGGADWRQEGVWLDVLRNLLRECFLAPAGLQAQVPWLQVSPVSGAVSGGADDFAIGFETAGMAPGTVEAVLVLIGAGPGGDVQALPATLTVDPHTLRVFTSGTVKDWRDLPLRGDGGASAAIYQVLYAGPDGVPDPPATNAFGDVTGAPTGDDRLLAVFPTREAFGRFGSGAGIPAGSGRFDGVFSVPLPPGTGNASVYVRAWDASSFSSSLAYGDSTLRHTLSFTSGESADFGSWQVTNAIDYARDSNTNSLPDGWVMRYRPDLDPRAGLEPLASSNRVLSVRSVPRNLSGDPAPKPYRVMLSSPSNAFMFALDNANNRIVTLPVSDPDARGFHGAPGSGEGQFSSPEGMALDPRAGHYRLAVADTDNHRVQTFTYDPDAGTLSFERAFGSYGSGTNQLNRPAGVAFDNTGRVFVADRLNNRVSVYRLSDGVWMAPITGTGGSVMNGPQGLSVDTDTVDGGVWVSDTGKHRVSLFTTAGVFKRTFGVQGSANGQFQTPVDVQVWRHRWTDPATSVERTIRRLCVVDKVNARVQVFRPDGTWLMNVGSGGSLAGQLRLPHGVYPVDDQPDLLVADTDNGRVQRFRLTLDADQDGMDDFWEDLHGLNSSVFDAYGDLDGDGLLNIAEYLIQTDPSNPDTNDDGTSDGDSVQDNLDPRKSSYEPTVLILSALPAIVPAGGEVTFTLVFDQPPPAGYPVELQLSGSATGTVVMLPVNATTFEAAYQTTPLSVGVADAALYGGSVSILEGSPAPVYLQSGLFSIYFPSFQIMSAGGVPIQLTWESVAGAWYLIETNATLLESGWGVFTNIVATGAPESTVQLAPPASSLFFRVKRVME